MRRRLVIRLSTAFVLQFAQALQGLFDRDFIKALVFIAISDANYGYIGNAPELVGAYDWMHTSPPDSLARPIRPHKLALSLGLPRETVRRKAAWLVAERFLVEAPQGLIVSADVSRREDLLTMIRVVNAHVVQLCRNLAVAGVGELARIPEEIDLEQLPQRAIGRLAVSYFLRSIDELRALFEGDVLTGLVYCAIVDANVSHLNNLPDLPYSDMDDHVPDEERRPISALALAERIGLPRETVRRHVRRAEARGLCLAVRGGLISPQETFRSPELIAATLRNWTNLRQFLTQLNNAKLLPRADAGPVSRREA